MNRSVQEIGKRRGTEKRKVIIDCDPGIDDCFALALALEHLDVLAITTVGGNVSLSYTSRNACLVTELFQKTEVPVYGGAEGPILGSLTTAEEIHGNDGLGGIPAPLPGKKPEKEHAVDFLVKAYLSYAGEEERKLWEESRPGGAPAFPETPPVLVTLAPLTNIALALKREPRLAELIPEIYCMGGSAVFGNITPAAEFNIAVDPEAAKIVFESGIPIRMIGLNVTRQARIKPEDVERLREGKGSVAGFYADLLAFNLDHGAELCDACAMAWVIDEKIMKASAKVPVEIETKGEFTRGMTVCDWRNFSTENPRYDLSHVRTSGFREERAANCQVALELDAKRFWRLLFGTLLKEQQKGGSR